MNASTRRWWTTSAALSFCVLMIACAGAPASDPANNAAGPAFDAAITDNGGEQREAGGEHGRSQADGEHGSLEADGEHGGSEAGEEHGGESGEHGGEGGEHGDGRGHEEGDEGEESGIYIGRAETWDQTRRGARLVLRFDAEQGAFVGTVANTTERTMCAVRVEVHLAGGPELGPTVPTDLRAGTTIDVELPAEGESFDTWTAHPEVSACR